MSQPVRRVAVVGNDESDGDGNGLRDVVRDVVRDAGGELVDPVEADAVVALGETGIVEATRGTSTTGVPDMARVPTLPVASGRYAVSRPSAPDAIRQLLSGDARLVDQPLLSVTVDGDRLGRAIFDVALVTDEPARISEYRVSFPSGYETSIRADALVIATPFGSDGYAGAAGGPILEPGTGLSVVPVAPFTTDVESWVVPDEVTLSVERDEEPVSLVVDDDRRDRVPAHEPIRVAVRERIEFLSVPASRGGR